MFASFTTRLHRSISAATKARNSSGVFCRYSTLSFLSRVGHVGLLQHRVEPGIELLDDRRPTCRPARTRRSIRTPRSPAACRRPAADRAACASRPLPVCAIALHLAALHQTDRRRAVGEEELHLPADHVVQRGPAAAIRDVIDLRAGARGGTSRARGAAPCRCRTTRSRARPGAALASAITSATVFASTEGVTTRMFGTSEARNTGWKSLP